MKIFALLLTAVFFLSGFTAQSQAFRPRYENRVVGGTDTYTLSISPSPVLQDGLTYSVYFTNGNSGASTLAVGTTGTLALVDADGTALSSGAISAGSVRDVRYDSHSNKWRLVGGGGSSGGVQWADGSSTAISGGTLQSSVVGNEKIPVSGTGHPVINTNRIFTYMKARMDSIYGGGGWATSGSTTVTTPTIVGASTFQGQVYITDNSGYIQVGTGGISSTSAGIYIGRDLNNGTASGNQHAFADNSTIGMSGAIGYNSFDAKVSLGGGVAYDHYAGFQARPLFGVSTMTNYYGTFMTGSTGSGTITNWYNHYSAALTLATGTITNMYGYYTEDITQGGTLNYAYYSAGNAISSFGGAQVRDLTVGNLVAATTSGRLTTGLRTVTFGTGASGADVLQFGGNSMYISANQSTGEWRFNAVSTYFPTFYSNGSEVLRLTTTGAAQHSGDVSFSSATKGIVLKDTQGTPHYWRITVTTLGVLVVTDIGTTIP